MKLLFAGWGDASGARRMEPAARAIPFAFTDTASFVIFMVPTPTPIRSSPLARKGGKQRHLLSMKSA